MVAELRSWQRNAAWRGKGSRGEAHLLAGGRAGRHLLASRSARQDHLDELEYEVQKVAQHPAADPEHEDDEGHRRQPQPSLRIVAKRTDEASQAAPDPAAHGALARGHRVEGCGRGASQSGTGHPPSVSRLNAARS